MARPERARLATDERRAQLLALGRRLFNERSYDEISIDDIAAAAGISKGLLYHYFPSKRDFYVETVRIAADELVAATKPDLDAPPAERLDRGLEAYLAYVEQNARGYVALLRGGIGVDVEVAAIVEGTRRALIELMRVSFPDPDAPVLRVALRGWVGQVEAVSVDWLEHRDLDRATVRKILARSLGALLSAAAGATSSSQET
jgi:AcrR family transcriptional regulator